MNELLDYGDERPPRRFLNLQQVADLLDAMHDEEGVAFMLDMHGIRGRRRKGQDYSCACPIARFAQLATGWNRISMDHGSIGPRNSRAIGRHYVSQNIANFVSSYDDGEWPELYE
jgi:hypothetical protein